MNRNKLSFESENFQIDYLNLNLQFNDLKRIKKIANYLSNTFDCNSTFTDCENSTQNRTLVKKERSSSKAKFRVNSQKYWYGTSLSFSGKNAAYSYKIIKETGLDWEILNFDNTSLSRIDLYYDRKFKKGDEIENFDSFLEQCRSQLEKTDKRKIAIVEKGVLRVGRRGSGNYFRVYRKSNGKYIRFELELTKSVVKNFEFYLFSNQFEKLEELLCIHFYKQALTTFVMDSCYTDWLRENFRNIRSSRRYENYLITTYFKTLPLETLEKQKFLYQLLQLLSYIRTLESSINWISSENYRMISFRVSEFSEFLGKKKTNYYQTRKVVTFLKSLQRLPPVLEDFSTESFRSILIFPYLEVSKEKSWKVELAIAEKVYFYRYPFYFPQDFLTCDDVYDLRAKIFFLLSFSTTELSKEFQIQEFFDQVGLSHQKTTRLRKSVLIIFEDALDSKLIEPRFTLLMKTNKTKEVEKLTSNLLVKAKSIFYTEIP
ncbi:hypothetical protein [Okeania sp. SIO1H4]|uniref:hypothetical protein n=1 Tax=Okeania sp. SIO1H4 TaxID=2607776 RepID=UPI0013C72FC3|nr:hypothetical protein [Okeania sp. SIO1H4]NES79939.1 hypothetical protein [Okeania sp. SIO1H4]